MVEEFGHGLKIVVSCQAIPEQDWLSFLCWCALNKNLPDAKVVFICERSDFILSWPYKVGVKVIYYTKKPVIDSVDLEITPNILAVRPYMFDNLGPVSVKSDLLTTFVDCLEGCGRLKIKGRKSFPSDPAKYQSELSANELQVIKLLESCESIYTIF